MDTGNAASEHSPKPRQAPSNLVQRILSAAVLLPLLAVVVWLGGWSVVGTVALAALLALRELYAMLPTGGFRAHPVGYVVGVTVLLVMVGRVFWQRDFLDVVLVGSIVGTLAVVLFQRDHTGALVNWALTLVGAWYVTWLLAHFIPLRQLPNGIGWIVLSLAVVFGSDTGAYFVGRSFGRHRLAPAVSPKKSWEGAIGGAVTSVVAAILVAWLAHLPITLAAAGVLGLVGSIVGQLGDLAESLMKRQVGVKDSGTIIPGHGGVLDRIDSLLFTIPVLYYCIVWLTR